ncbi:MAG: metalloregulator ArsR/SmtB family transcription factor [Verrucomicrobia bacterium]|nr:metalloregulator ArsR/SmtB family transcription factor [Verrucomicrobiota bacterium]
MKKAEQERLLRRADILKALAHPSRLLMVEKLAEGERCVCELQKMVGADMSTVSKHLSVLKRAGLVQDDKRGLQVFYRLLSPCVLNFFTCVESVIEARKKRGRAACEIAK